MTIIEKAMHTNKEASQLYERIIGGNGSFEDLNDFAGITGRIAGEYITKQLGEEYPVGNVTEEDVRRVVSPILKQIHRIVAEVAAIIQNENFKKAGVGLKAMISEYDKSREDELVMELSRRSFIDGLGG